MLQLSLVCMTNVPSQLYCLFCSLFWGRARSHNFLKVGKFTGDQRLCQNVSVSIGSRYTFIDIPYGVHHPLFCRIVEKLHNDLTIFSVTAKSLPCPISDNE